MPHFKAIIFDLDGTLIHSAPDLQYAVNEALKSIGRTTLDLPTVISFIGNGVEVLVRRALIATGGIEDALHRDVLVTFLQVYEQNMTTLTQPYAGVVACLEQFADQGVPMGICTNKPTAPAIGICKALRLDGFFDVIMGAEDGIAKKPDPEPLLACIKALGMVPQDTLYVGDSAVDYHTARNANVAFRLFSEGYLNENLPDLKAADRFDDWAMHGISIR